ncbi:MAG: TIGR04255 family protein [Magnetococcales bacterium]|nr:TIGR04255 family protein [Magnetococcales bacterium]
MNPIPKRLNKEPLIEAIWQVQFEPASDQPVGDLLPGILYAALRNDHPNLLLHRLPTADIPSQVAQFDPSLRHMAKFRMEETGVPFLFQVGDRAVTLNCRKPYVGWIAFKQKILALIDTLETSRLMPVPQRHSLRYIDLLNLAPAPDLSALQLALQLGDFDVQARPLQMRLELEENECLHVIQFATPANVQLPEGLTEGSIVDLETVATTDPKDWQEARDQLEKLHDRSKHLFFEHILTKEAIEHMEPEY